MSDEFAGTLSEHIVIERRSALRDGLGLRQQIWELVCRCRASVRPDGFGAASQGEAASALPKYRITIRPRDGIAIDQRISWGQRKMLVRQLVDDPAAKDRIEMRCEEMC